MSDETKAGFVNVLEAVPRGAQSSVFQGAGTVLFRQGEAGNCAYMVERGEMRATRRVGGQERYLRDFRPGDLLGELGLMDDGLRAATVTAMTDCELVIVTREQLERETNASPPLVKMVNRVLMERYRRIVAVAEADEDLGLHAGEQVRDVRLDTANVKALREIQLERQLRHGIESQAFEVHYQPIVALQTRRLAGLEALVRWRRPDEGLVLPSEFIGLAERSGLIVPIGASVMGQAAQLGVQILERLRERNDGSIRPFMSVNVSARQLATPDDVERLQHAIEQAAIDPGLIKLEITESLLIENEQAATAVLQRLKCLGVSVAIDDFGTGYASLNYLCRYPLDTMKIDRSFVIDIDNSGTRKVIRSMVVLANSLGMDVVAEGIETQAQMRALIELGCNDGQGYLFGKPMPGEQALRLAAAEQIGDW